MTTATKLTVALLVILEAAAGLGMIAISVHGPNGLPVAAGIYFLLAAGLTWWVGSRSVGVVRVLAAGIALLAAAPGVVFLLERIEHFAFERRVAATRVSDVRDEPILSASGRPIGVRVAYSVTVPDRGYFYVLPSLDARDAATLELGLHAVSWTIDGSSDPRPFEAGRTHVMVVELYPSILAMQRSGRCLVPRVGPPLPGPVTPAPLRIMISETPYGTIYAGNPERLTRESYDVGELYRGVLAEGLPPCGPP